MSNRDFTPQDLVIITQAVQRALDTSDLNDALLARGSKMPPHFDSSYAAPDLETAREGKALGFITLEGWDESEDEGVEIQLVVRKVARGGASLTVTGLDPKSTLVR